MCLIRPTDVLASPPVGVRHESPSPIATDRARWSAILDASPRTFEHGDPGDEHRDPLAIMLGRSNERAIDRINADAEARRGSRGR